MAQRAGVSSDSQNKRNIPIAERGICQSSNLLFSRRPKQTVVIEMQRRAKESPFGSLYSRFLLRIEMFSAKDDKNLVKYKLQQCSDGSVILIILHGVRIFTLGF